MTRTVSPASPAAPDSFSASVALIALRTPASARRTRRLGFRVTVERPLSSQRTVRAASTRLLRPSLRATARETSSRNVPRSTAWQSTATLS